MFAEAFGYTPVQFRALSYVDFAVLAEHLQRKAEAMERATRGY